MIALAFRKPLAFLKKDLIIESSYKLSFISQIFGIFISVLTFFFLGKLFSGSSAISSYLKPYGGDYFSFVLIGVAFSDLMMTSMYIFEGQIRDGQISGTLEPLLVTQTSLLTILLSSSVYGFLLSFVRTLLYLIVGFTFFGASYNFQGLLLAVAVMAVSLVNFSAIGIISASFILVFKKGNPVNWIFGSVSELLGGVLYPITVLPVSLQFIAKFLPITYTLRAMRAVLIQNRSFIMIFNDIAILVVMGFVLSIIAYISFNVATRKVKTDGSISHF